MPRLLKWAALKSTTCFSDNCRPTPLMRPWRRYFDTSLRKSDGTIEYGYEPAPKLTPELIADTVDIACNFFFLALAIVSQQFAQIRRLKIRRNVVGSIIKGSRSEGQARRGHRRRG